MELKWLEDYLTLVDTGNFTAAAALRNVSQPAFSRRIQALESWLGIELIDRSRRPLRFTAAALEHESTLRNLANLIYQARNQVRFSMGDQVRLTVAAQHSLLATPFLPRFLEKVAASVQNLNYSVVSENMDSCVALFLKGAVDLLVIYESAPQASAILPHLSLRKDLGSDEMTLVARPQILKQLQARRQDRPLPLLVYPIGSFFGNVVWNDAVPRVLREQNATIACESTFAVGLREMAIAGTGAAWLPRSIVLDELRRGDLVALDAISQPIPLQVVAHLSKISEGRAIAELREIL